jgi:hypothetical protein
MTGLVQMAKDYGCIEYFWGVHAHLSEVTDLKSTANEAKLEMEMTQKHTNYKVSMAAEELVLFDQSGQSDIHYSPDLRKACCLLLPLLTCF